MAEFPDEFGFSVSHTTRGPRPGEADGVHYNFTTVEAMQAAIALGGSGPRAKANHRNKDPGTPDKPAAKEVPPKVRLCRKIAAEAGVRPRVVQQHIASTPVGKNGAF